VTSGTAILGLSDGTYAYTVTKEGYKTVTGEVTVLGDTTVPTITLTEIFTVGFTVTANDGTTPINGATITLSSGMDFIGTFTTDSQGKASTTLVDGDYSWTAEKEGYVTSTPAAFTVNGAAMPGLIMQLNRVVAVTVATSQAAIVFNASAEIVYSTESKLVNVMYTLYDGDRMVGITTRSVLLTSTGINDSAIVNFNANYQPDICKIFILDDSRKPMIPHLTEILTQ